MDEESLIRKAQAGDVHAYNRLVLRHQDAAYNVATYILGDPDSAADATQDAFISAYKALNRYTTGNFKAWIMTIVRNKCRDQLRKKKRHPEPSLDEMTDENESLSFLASADSGPETQQEQRELMQAVSNCLQNLSEDQRSTIVLCDVEGYDYNDIATTLSISLGTVKSRINRARRKLRDCLQASMELLPDRYRLENGG